MCCFVLKRVQPYTHTHTHVHTPACTQALNNPDKAPWFHDDPAWVSRLYCVASLTAALTAVHSFHLDGTYRIHLGEGQRGRCVCDRVLTECVSVPV